MGPVCKIALSKVNVKLKSYVSRCGIDKQRAFLQ